MSACRTYGEGSGCRFGKRPGGETISFERVMNMAVTILPSRQAMEDMQAVCRIEPSAIEAMLARVDELTATVLHPEQVRKSLASIEGISQNDVRSILRLIFSFINLQRNAGLTPEDTLRILDGRIPEKGSSELPTGFDFHRRWRDRRQQVKRLLENPRLRTVAKALDLSYDYMNLLQSAKVITDIRPIYDDEASRVDGLIVSFTLRLLFDEGDVSHNLSLAMDERDVLLLQKECERAIKKCR